MLNEDIKEIDLASIREQVKAVPDIIIGGPPCQGFSNAAGLKNFQDSRNELFKEFYKWVDFFNPNFFVIENVLGLTSKKDSSGVLYKSLILEHFRKIGYHVSFWTLNALEYGVPQQRIRVFFVGSKLSNEDIPKPTPTHSIDGKILNKAITVKDAIDDLPILLAGQGIEEQNYTKKTKLSQYQKWARQNADKVFNHVAMNHTDRLVQRYKLIQEGTVLMDVPEEFKVRQRSNKECLSSVEFGLNYRHLKPDKISYTIPASFYSSFIHPYQPRNITTREAARLQSFPDDYVFFGKRTLMSNSFLKKMGIKPTLSQYNQVGNAVPPLMAKAIAEKLMSLM